MLERLAAAVLVFLAVVVLGALAFAWIDRDADGKGTTR